MCTVKCCGVALKILINNKQKKRRRKKGGRRRGAGGGGLGSLKISPVLGEILGFKKKVRKSMCGHHLVGSFRSVCIRAELRPAD